jgi:BirA family transcriptional regulator, biotin operon repressor / biotin---[acetyl-CoA-carboxylase] ligase
LRSNASDLIEAFDRARPRLGRLAASIDHLPVVGSTNDAAKQSRLEGAVIVADAQTAGRGRSGHRWFSPAGTGLYVSVVLAPSRARRDPRRATLLLTIAAGVAIVEGVETATGLRADLKWPNDVYAGSRKLAGILAESNGELVIAGYGVNVAVDAYPRELRDRVTSLEAELGRSVDRATVFAETLAALATRYDDLLEGRFDAILDAWRSRAPNAVGARVEWTAPNGIKTGTTDGIDDDGALRVQTGSGVERIVSGELRWE